MVCLLAAPWVQLSVSAGNGCPHNALRHHWLVPISCHFQDCKALLVTGLTHVSGAIASVQTFTFTFTFTVTCLLCGDAGALINVLVSLDVSTVCVVRYLAWTLSHVTCYSGHVVSWPLSHHRRDLLSPKPRSALKTTNTPLYVQSRDSRTRT